jgi:uncharacterized protein
LKRAALGLALAGLGAAAQVAVPPLTSRINDFTGTLSGGAVSRIESEIADLEATRGSHIAVLMVASTQPEDIEQFAARTMRQWQQERAIAGDSAILLVAKNDRRVRIEVGSGLTPILSPAVSNRIEEEIIAPHFELGDYEGGVAAGVHQMIAVVNGASVPEPDRGWARHRGLHRAATLLVGLLLGAGAVILWGAFASSRPGGRRRRHGSPPVGPDPKSAGGASGRW